MRIFFSPAAVRQLGSQSQKVADLGHNGVAHLRKFPPPNIVLHSPQISNISISELRHLLRCSRRRRVILKVHATLITPKPHCCMVPLTHSTIQNLRDAGVRCSPHGGYQRVSPQSYHFISLPSLRPPVLFLRS